jgi:SAM-dependent methyltransferase
MSILSEILAHPLARGVPLDDPKTTELRRRIIWEKRFLRRIYETWYRDLLGCLPDGPGAVLEIGSGGGFLKKLFREVFTSEVFFVQHVDIVLDAMATPFRSGSLRAIIMVNVLHHVREPESFFREAAECIRSRGRCLFIEPWNTPWGRWVYQNFHHEPFDPGAEWTIALRGPLSGANGALPWILFDRDRGLFYDRFPQWRIADITPIMPLTYLLSGGVSRRISFPGWSYDLVRRLEKSIPCMERGAGMFARIVLERV